MIAQISVYLQAVDLLREGARRPSDFCLRAGPVSGEEVSCRAGVASDPAVVRGCAQRRGVEAFAVVGVEFELDLDVLLVGHAVAYLSFAGPTPGLDEVARVPRADGGRISPPAAGGRSFEVTPIGWVDAPLTAPASPEAGRRGRTGRVARLRAGRAPPRAQSHRTPPVTILSIDGGRAVCATWKRSTGHRSST